MPDQEISSDPLAGTIQDGGFISDKPPDIDEFLTEAGLIDKQYVCTIKRAPKEGSGAKEFLPGSLKGTYMPIDECGKRFGPGQYFYLFAWHTVDEHGKQKKQMKEYKIYLGSEWDDIYDDYQAEIWAKKEKNIIQLAQRKKLQDATRGILPNDVQADKTDPIENLKQTMSIMKDIGVPIGPNGAGDNTQMMMFMMQMQQKASETNMQMFATMNANMMNMMSMMMNGNKQQSNQIQFKEMMEMVQGMVGMKEILNPEKKGVVDKVFELFESMMPAILELAKKPKAIRQADPLVNVIKTSEDFNEIKKDPEMLKEAIRKWDKAHGSDKTDIILETVGLKRPGAFVPEDEPIITEPPPAKAPAEDTNIEEGEINDDDAF